MNPPSLRTAVTGISACFNSSILRKACISHRTARLATYANSAAPRHSEQRTRRYATAASDDHTSGHATAGRRLSLTSFSPDSKEHEYAKLIRALDPYLPLDYRSGTYKENLSRFEGVRNPRTLPKVLNDIDGKFPQGVLTYIALSQYRWSAYLYLTQALIRSEDALDDIPSAVFEGSPWNSLDTRFPDIGRLDGHVVFNTEEQSHSVADHADDADNESSKSFTAPATKDHLLSDPSWSVIGGASEDAPDLIPSRHKAMGYLWQSLGHIILKSTFHPAEYAAYMMSHVHRVLAFLHHEGKVHPSTYEFDSETAREVMRKSPYLHIMGSRLIATMAEASWKAQESKVIAYYDQIVATDQKTTGPKIFDEESLVWPIGAETWLELILWSCVQDRHAEAAIAIVDDMMSGDGQEHWATISWPELLASALESASDYNAKGFEARFNRVAGEGYRMIPPLVALPAYTISCEVLFAVFNLMASSHRRESAWDVVNRFQKFKDLLPVGDSYAARTFWNAALVRLLDTADFPPDAHPTYLDAVATIPLRDEVIGQQSSSLARTKHDQEHTTGLPIEVLHHKAIAAFLSLGDLRGALCSFDRLKGFLDHRKWKTITKFLDTAQPQQSLELTSGSISEAMEAQRSVTLRDTRFAESDLVDDKPEEYGIKIPSRTLGLFLDQVVRQDMLDLGKWMVFSTDPDDVPLISGKDFSSPVVQPSLILLGVALGDARLVRKVVKRIRHGPKLVDASILLASLQAQTVLRKFAHAEAILTLMRERAIEISNTCVFEVARTILQLESTETTASTQQDLSDACRLLGNMLRAQYSPTPLAHERPNYALAQRLNQLSCMIASVGGHAGAAAGRNVFRPTTGQVTVAASDFEILLEAVTEAQGPTMAKALYDRWCRPPQSEMVPDSKLAHNPILPLTGWYEPDSEACVEPSRRTVQTIIKPILRFLRNEGKHIRDVAAGSRSTPLEPILTTSGNKSDGELIIKPGLPLKPLDRPILEWAMYTLLSLGWKADEVASEIPEAFETQQAECAFE